MNFCEYFNIFLENFKKKEVYHGTPNEKEFDKISLSFIGQGQGAQTFGWGIYFAENKSVADSYRYAGKELNKTKMSEIDHLSYEEAKERLNKNLPLYAKGFYSDWYEIKSVDSLDHAIEFLTGSKFTSGLKTRGNLYKFNLNVHDFQLLDWDKPMREQSAYIRIHLKFLTNLLKELKYKKFKDGGGHIVDKDGNPQYNTFTAVFSQEDLDKEIQKISNIYFYMADVLGSPKKASMWFFDRGVKGIKYFDANSRKKALGTSNFVIFDESVIEKVNN